MNGSSRDELAQSRTRRRNGESKAATVTASRLSIVLNDGMSVVFSASDITLARVAESITDVKKELDNAIKNDHDARTLGALMKKRARQLGKKG